MTAQTWSGGRRLLALAILGLATLVACQAKPGEVQFTSPCSDVIDPWTPMSQDERVEACRELLGSKVAELGDMGFSIQDCQVSGAKVQECGIGTELACTYRCDEEAE